MFRSQVVGEAVLIFRPRLFSGSILARLVTWWNTHRLPRPCRRVWRIGVGSGGVLVAVSAAARQRVARDGAVGVNAWFVGGGLCGGWVRTQGPWVVTYASGGALLLFVCGALATTSAERCRPASTIDGFGDGLWLAVTTLSTVGYGDTCPVSTTGVLVVIAHLLAGIAQLGVVTATFASWLVERVADSNELSSWPPGGRQTS